MNSIEGFDTGTKKAQIGKKFQNLKGKVQKYPKMAKNDQKWLKIGNKEPKRTSQTKKKSMTFD